MVAAQTAAGRSFNWYDIVVGVALAYGVWSGIRTGLFVEVLRVVGIVAMVAAAVHFYIPAGDRFQSWSGIAREPARLMAFVVIAVAVYVVSVALRNLVSARAKKVKFLAFTDNVGGAVAGLIRMAVAMVLVTIMISLMRSPYWHQQVSVNSVFGSAVVQQLPEVAAVVQKSFPEKLWITKELKRREEPDVDKAGVDTTSH
jgi:membrane protein required for colicin V production